MKTKQPKKKSVKRTRAKVQKQSEEDSAGVAPVPTWYILAAVVLIVFIIYAVFYVLRTEDVYEYNGFTFAKTDCGTTRECWQTQVNTNVGVRSLYFYNGPRDVESIPVDQSAVNFVLNLGGYNNSQIVIVFDEQTPGEVGVAATNIARITGERIYNITTSGSVYGQPTTCEHANQVTAVIYLTQGPHRQVTFEQGCIMITAPDAEGVLEVADAYSLHLLTIL